MKQTAISHTNIAKNKILGILERVSFPEFPEVGEITAKVDTGAYSGSLHCTHIAIQEKNGEKTLVFSPFDHPEVKVYTTNFSIRGVTSSNGAQQRYFIQTTIHIAGQDYPIRMNLADRSQLKREMLIGRRFLKRHGFLVDVTKSNR